MTFALLKILALMLNRILKAVSPWKKTTIKRGKNHSGLI